MLRTIFKSLPLPLSTILAKRERQDEFPSKSPSKHKTQALTNHHPPHFEEPTYELHKMKLPLAAFLLAGYAQGQTYEPGNFSDGTKLVE